ncbi:dihydropteroate synthase [Conexivisphaera calida]|uniref:dihydropteroate synthase n=1 Tax=Conexivisphaera calida TaxID=1874277 RepID=A0A4V0P1J9_9ARCH|nr:dihydropteroate synthase [Conexivisphaera calida]BBE41980.1 Dihydropteroate synthase [Conexivisphaera calida]
MLRARLGKVEVGEGLPVKIMGALNASPESFYRGSVVGSPEDALRIASSMIEEGADIIDVGGMSTAPYVDARSVPPEVEASRVVPIVRALSRELGAVVSVDTVRASVAEAAIGAGAEIVNDVSGCRADPSMARVIADSGASAVLGVREDETPVSGTPMETVRRGLSESLRACASSGVDPSRLTVDPGIGFFRTGVEWYRWDSEVVGGIRRLYALLRPVVIGVSRKSFIGRILELPDPGDRLTGTVAAEAIAVFAGAHVVRAHDVREAVQAARLGEALRPRIRAAGSAVDLTRFLEPEDGWSPGRVSLAVAAPPGDVPGIVEEVEGMGGRVLEMAPGILLVHVRADLCGRLGTSRYPALAGAADLCGPEAQT